MSNPATYCTFVVQLKTYAGQNYGHTHWWKLFIYFNVPHILKDNVGHVCWNTGTWNPAQGSIYKVEPLHFTILVFFHCNQGGELALCCATQIEDFIMLQLCLRVESFWWVLTFTGRKLVAFYPQSEESYVTW